MEFSQLLEIAGEEPAFETGLLLADEVDPADVRRPYLSLAARVYPLAPPACASCRVGCRRPNCGRRP